MAPIKFEENLKDKLEKRTIEPSADAWSSLSKRLDAQDKKQDKKLFWWIGIAASIVGILFVSSIFFKTTDLENNSEIIVDTEVGVPKQDHLNTNEIEKIDVLTDETKVAENTETLNPNTIIKDKESSSVIPKGTKISTPGKEVTIKQATVFANQNEEEAIQIKKAVPVNALDFEKAKVDAVVEQIIKLKAERNLVTDSEIDSLLKQAQKDILKHKIYNERTRTVDANALLQDVEADLEQSFRAKVFDALKNSYDTVKTAVAERNN